MPTFSLQSIVLLNAMKQHKHEAYCYLYSQGMKCLYEAARLIARVESRLQCTLQLNSIGIQLSLSDNQ